MTTVSLVFGVGLLIVSFGLGRWWDLPRWMYRTLWASEGRVVRSLEEDAIDQCDLFFVSTGHEPTELRGHPKTVDALAVERKLDRKIPFTELVFWSGPSVMKVIEDDEVPEGLWVVR